MLKLDDWYKKMKGRKIEIGQTYFDIWCYQHKIHGYTMSYGKLNDKIVYSPHGWYNLDGTAYLYGYRLVLLPPNEEIKFWNWWMAQIKSVNSEDKLKIVQRNLDAMQKRIECLKDQSSKA